MVPFNTSFCFLFHVFVAAAFLGRYGANANPKDAGELPIIAMLDKLVETPQPQLNVELCLRLLLKTVPSIEMPYKVCTHTLMAENPISKKKINYKTT